MENKELDKALAVLAILAAVIVAALVATILTTGISQEFFQSARPIEAHVAQLTGNPTHAVGLRLGLGLDNLFILIYVTFFVLLAMRFRAAMSPVMIGVALGAFLLTAVLDAIENHHILMMLHSAERGIPLSTQESQIQMIASGVKFHASYLGIFLFAFGYRQQGRLGRTIAWIFWLTYIPLGILISVIPVETVRPFALGRTVFFVIAFLLSAALFLRGTKPGNN